jgi:pSer/pThr/pTyr-binding forkhead associated (FHA) protein
MAMPMVTFRVLEGIDKGRIFRDLTTPVTIGREEGNVLRLNDERVSRYHAKVQADNNEIILTDLESTNGTRVNGNVVQIRRLRPGDRIGVGRSLLLFGSEAEIAARGAQLTGMLTPATARATLPSQTVAGSVALPEEVEFDLNLREPITSTQGNFAQGGKELPPLPQKLTPSQAARLAEMLDFLHRQITRATENIHANEDCTQVALGYGDWQQVLAVQMLLARYVRAVAEPDALEG